MSEDELVSIAADIRYLELMLRMYARKMPDGDAAMDDAIEGLQQAQGSLRLLLNLSRSKNLSEEK